MGEFVVRVIGKQSGLVLSQFVAANVLAYEGTPDVYAQMFPPYAGSPLTFDCGVGGATDSDRPNSGGGLVFDGELTFANVTDLNANEGGGYTPEMRNSFGYARLTPAFVASRQSDGGQILTQEMEFPNHHAWTPQNGAAWDDPNTTTIIEQPPPEWHKHGPDDPEVGYPWHAPRKLCGDIGFPLVSKAYMKTWQPDGSLDYLCDFRQMGGFPITLAFISAGSSLVAAAQFAAPVHLRPGLSLFVAYRARIDGNVTGDFALRMARFVFAKSGNRYDTIWCRPALAPAPPPRRSSTYSEYAPHFQAGFAAIELDAFAVNAAARPVYTQSTSQALEWLNSTGASVGPFNYMVVYGIDAGVEELIWAQPITPPVNVPDGDTLRIPAGVKFSLVNI